MLTTLHALDDGRLRDRTVGWVVTIAITLMAFALRVWNVGYPAKILFDETYYAKEAWGILHSGYERKWGEDANAQIAEGDLSGFLDAPSYVVHPPLGKMLIALGEWGFGMTPFGWRISAVVFGTLLVFFTIRLARRLSRSTLVGAMAGLILTFDGLAFVMSRLALLDVFQATFAVAAVSALVADRDWFRHKLADHLRSIGEPDLGGRFGPLLLWRPWRVLAGVLFGASCAVKWNSIFMVAAFGILVVFWDLGARRLAGAGRKQWWSLAIDAPAAFVQLVVVAVPVYIASWFRWLTTDGGYYRQWGVENPDDPVVQRVGAALGALWHYHHEAYNFHTGEKMMQEATHPYEAHPAGWLFMIRPIGIEAVNGIEPGTDGCDAVGTTCLRIISAMGTPLLWWFAAAAIAAAVVWWILGRDWRFGVPLLGIASTYLPWFRYADRPLFFFYAIMIIPFSATVLAMALGKILGPVGHPRRRLRAMAVGIVLALIILNFAFIYPILTADLLTKPAWMLRMWLGNAWI
ncbi:Dolichyl-phosphate-mannose-protein mannosyltransferase [Tessaracoccus flavus]|nr:Dolichyl-phosphate-mannose-protein mannosyltransferase [Tessaracoccus flavus]